MDTRDRLIVGGLWLAVAGVMAITLELGLPSTASEVARLFVVVVALLLAVLYLFDPWELVSGQPFH
ncbi:hypothetical protein [Natronobacterium gregoryi]|uniref:Uncharacterized protein n=2 Tax=Natronobacterium gregoryi TaxID=44930 RepID=L0ADG8_NATGS|nr:hypothetical protein [Natronobacterium gregoryi]AFZ71958.1 hypothetical protein Natgr_0713 [Natronobacterium gregoryi SP2]ELY62545.1 hypothetical protein C490_17696 [Natronobacterium gregoryi SP2]PLK20734.1 hypothetical protein CYV19_08275 [Natronobacterium gregoryi SP2]SFJ12752.1 hypothetical protein SAMN05443661_1159 [Natronobacterium gregoryi]